MKYQITCLHGGKLAHATRLLYCGMCKKPMCEECLAAARECPGGDCLYGKEKTYEQLV
jgi:hypothetical protein